jgi:hypothetical protein
MRASALLSAILLGTCLLAGAARGDEASKRARDAYNQGTAFFSLGQWDKAIESWTSGYQLKPDPIFLYNIAQAYRLAENHERALFFYKSFLNSAPRAPNRDEVREKIEQLQKLIEEKRSTLEMPPNQVLTPDKTFPKAAAPPPSRKQPPPVAEAAPPPRAAATPIEPPVATPAPPAPAVEASGAVVARVPAPRPSRRGDLSVSGGVELWALGLSGTVGPAAGFTLGGGYALLVTERVEAGVGVKLGYTYLADVASTDHFISLLLDPVARVRLWRERLYAFGELGVGALVISGLARRSALLEAHAAPSGSLGAFELRPALGLEYRILPLFAVFVAPALVYSPTPSHFVSASLLRFDLAVGASLRF